MKCLRASFVVRGLPGRLLLLACLLLSACASTRDLPVTELPRAPALPAALKTWRLEVEPLHSDDTLVRGNHHEGVAQLPQPWIWGISDAQRHQLHAEMKTVVDAAFFDELARLGLQVRRPPADDKERAGGQNPRRAGAPVVDLVLRGAIKSIELNTYGRGLKGKWEGYGSAGNYWEARLELTAVRLADRRSGKVYFEGDLQQYAKRPDSPVTLDMTVSDVIYQSASLGLAGTQPLKVAKAVRSSKADYSIGNVQDNPVEFAARLAARELVSLIARQALPSGTDK